MTEMKCNKKTQKKKIRNDIIRVKAGVNTTALCIQQQQDRYTQSEICHSKEDYIFHIEKNALYNKTYKV